MNRHVWGEHKPHGHLSPENLLNAGLILSVFIIWKWTADGLGPLCEGEGAMRGAEFGWLDWICSEPLPAVSVLLLLDVSLLFWCIGLLQGSFWLIDPFWTWIPFMITYAYLTHPMRPTEPLSLQFKWVFGLLTVWSLRLTHSYFRREGYKLGEREDWRYSVLAQKCGALWWWISFWAVGILQQLLLTGLTFPVFSVLFRPSPHWTLLDSIAVVLCIVGIGVAFSADNDLHAYMNANPRNAVLRTGLWQFSRHPNYFGEQLFWWSLCLFSLSHGDTWALTGPLLNTLVLAKTTKMTEERMIQNWEQSRVASYRKYRKTTSAWIPWANTWDKQ